MKPGEVWGVDFEPARGGEIRKTRPALIVSNDVANANLKRLQLVPLTSNSGRLYPSGSEVSVAGQVSKAMADQLATVAKERLGKQLGALTRDDLRQVERVLKIQLGLKI